jgi:hypothetical protein
MGRRGLAPPHPGPLPPGERELSAFERIKWRRAFLPLPAVGEGRGEGLGEMEKEYWRVWVVELITEKLVLVKSI